MQVFVYGSLKADQYNHDRHFPSDRAVKQATIKGRLYNQGSFPGLWLEPKAILAKGELNTIKAHSQQLVHMRILPLITDPIEGDVVHGELISFEDTKWLAQLDQLEGYWDKNPKFNLYSRVLTEVNTKDGIESAFVYIMDESRLKFDKYIPTGIWP
jgi:gamma-glutamylcyclotransferase (GGCT)/AIG2-like uncharacterized protein YtfP